MAGQPAVSEKKLIGAGGNHWLVSNCWWKGSELDILLRFQEDSSLTWDLVFLNTSRKTSFLGRATLEIKSKGGYPRGMMRKGLSRDKTQQSVRASLPGF